ncbi:MAG: endonuclease/exonuclease/phosphatase family protein [Actinomycetota bacterium]|nr:endonuclease/exonuclease/phosphatase family protein [Actinomycetota bacterium]
MTYNIFMGGRRGAPLHELVRAVAPEILLVNESPKRPLLWRRDCERLCQLWGMRYVAGGRSAGSNMLAVRGPVEVRWADAKVLAQPRLQPRRGIVSAQLRVHGRLMGVIGCHLSLVAERRQQEVGAVLEAAARLRGPVVLAGDLNETPERPAWQWFLREGFVDPGDDAWLTFPSDHPGRRIDALLVRGGTATVLSHGDPGAPAELQAAASDHRGVVAELEL